ncbi:uncharacterized protein LOC119098611 [Pollicipes pollicipes]|uniref:uncharacterized protein LOC119098611 n=1 Tax=Pollicipes pollicipes TaxID=41117 RepID=UPI001884D804|nr:uncharacterized protein LOC119098611 [Pollicipes pollicipes]
MKTTLVIAFLSGMVAGRQQSQPTAGSDFIEEPEDATVPPGASVELDCELVEGDVGDICSWRISGTHLGVDHFYNVDPPAKVRALFPEHERVCSIAIDNIDSRHDGFWTCWPLGPYSHISSRAARVTVTGDPITTTEPPPAPSTTTSGPSTVSWWTLNPASTITPDTTTPETTTATVTTPSPAPTTTRPPSPGFDCPQPYGLFADPENPRYYYYCEESMAIHLQCEFPSMWSDSDKRCA